MIDLNKIPELIDIDLDEIPELLELEELPEAEPLDDEAIPWAEDFARRCIESSRSDPDGGRYHLQFLLRMVSRPADYQIPPELAARYQAEVSAAIAELERLEAAPGAHDGAEGIPGQG